MTDSQRPDGIVVAIDGPAGSGKSSTAKAVAAALGYRHLDSGAFYRAVTLAALDRGIPPEAWEDLSAAELRDLRVSATGSERGFDISVGGEPVGDRIRSPAVNANVSRMAAVRTVREWLLESLRGAGTTGGLVADGRDVGTVVFPDAELKVFLVATPETRARRRLHQDGNRSPTPAEVGAEARRLEERDRMDSARTIAPLTQAPDAILLDTSSLEFDQQVAEIIRLARLRIRADPPGPV